MGKGWDSYKFGGLEGSIIENKVSNNNRKTEVEKSSPICPPAKINSQGSSMKYIKTAEEVGIAYANRLYADFTEYREYRGKNFSWPKFPDMCGRIASVSLFSCFSDEEWSSLTDAQIDVLKNACSKAAIKRAKELLNK